MFDNVYSISEYLTVHLVMFEPISAITFITYEAATGKELT